jgi:hypothetical protein
MAESVDIIRYLYQTNALWTPPNKLLQWASESILPLAKPLFGVLAPLQAGSSNKDNVDAYHERIAIAQANIESTIRSAPVVVYIYGLSPFSFETKALLDCLGVAYREVSLGGRVDSLFDPGRWIGNTDSLARNDGPIVAAAHFRWRHQYRRFVCWHARSLPFLEQGKLQSMVGGGRANQAIKARV